MAENATLVVECLDCGAELEPARRVGGVCRDCMQARMKARGLPLAGPSPQVHGFVRMKGQKPMRGSRK
jgi:hypothetical protein